MLTHNDSEFLRSLKHRSPKPLTINRYYGILIPLVQINKEWHLLFEVRAHSLRAQPGEVCFPGGGCESSETPDITAIRETCEELGIPPTNIDLLFPCDYIVSPSRAILQPYAAIITLQSLDQLSPNPDEVDSVFTIPLDFLINAEPEVYELETEIKASQHFPYHKIQHGEDYPWRIAKHRVIFYEYNHHIVWGLTAALLQGFLDTIKENLTAFTKNQ